jgi:deoxyadenosine/deoxycytidine kinase
MNQVKKPDLYLILDVDWKNFEKRIMERGREQEIENFEKNREYFKQLMSDYTTKVVAQCAVYDIPYVVINTNNISEDEVFKKAIAEIKKVM